MPFRKERKAVAATLIAVLALLPVPAAAEDAPLSGPDLATVMTAYAEAAVELRDIYAACTPTAPGGWDEGAALLVESLRAAGLDYKSLAAIASAMVAAPGGRPVDCKAPAHALRVGLPEGSDWPAYHRSVLESAGLEVVVAAAGDERLAAAGAVVAKALPPQARMLECLSLLDPRGFVFAYGDWDRLVARVGGLFAAAGYAPHVYGPILEPAAAGRLFQAPADRAAAAAACAADQDWFERYSTMAGFSLAGDVETALKGGNQ